MLKKLINKPKTNSVIDDATGGMVLIVLVACILCLG